MEKLCDPGKPAPHGTRMLGVSGSCWKSSGAPASNRRREAGPQVGTPRESHSSGRGRGRSHGSRGPGVGTSHRAAVGFPAPPGDRRQQGRGPQRKDRGRWVSLRETTVPWKEPASSGTKTDRKTELLRGWDLPLQRPPAQTQRTQRGGAASHSRAPSGTRD